LTQAVINQTGAEMATTPSSAPSTPTTEKPSMSPHRPDEAIVTLATAFVPSTCLRLVAELAVAEQIAEDAVSVDELAARCGADAGAPDRVLALLASHNIIRRHAALTRTPPRLACCAATIRTRCAPGSACSPCP
jgi:hypothetical protein